MRTKTVAVAATTTIIAAFALAPSALAKGKDDPGKSAAHANQGVRAASTVRAASSNNNTPSSAATAQSGISGITGLLTGTLSGLGVGPGNGKGNGQANGQAKGQANGRAAATGQTKSNGNGNGNGLQLGPISVNLGGGSSSAVAAKTTPASAPTVGSSSAAPTPAPARGGGAAKTITVNAPASNTPSAPRLGTAPEDLPALPSQHQRGTAATTAARPGQEQAAAYPTSLNDVEDGTALLVGVLIVFMIGVISVVVSAGYRSRRASHRVR